jgi:hypothetical protein
VPGFWTLTCGQTAFEADLNSNANATTSITGRVTSLTFTSCTDTVSLIDYISCSLHGGSGLPTVRLTGGSASSGSVSLANVVVRCALVGGGANACYLKLDGAGSFGNATSSLTFSSLPVASVAPTPTALGGPYCFAGGSLNVTLNHIVQGGTNRTVTLTTA